MSFPAVGTYRSEVQMSPSFSGCQESGERAISAARLTPRGLGARGSPALPAVGRHWSCGHHGQWCPGGSGWTWGLWGLARSIRCGLQSPWHLPSGVSARVQGPRNQRGGRSVSATATAQSRSVSEEASGAKADHLPHVPVRVRPRTQGLVLGGQRLHRGFVHSRVSYSVCV